MLKIDSQEFLSFINKSTINGKINNFALDFKPEGIVFYESDLPKHSYSMGLLKRETFIEYEEVGKIIFSNTEIIKNKLGRFVGNIEIKITENKMFINGLDVNRDCEILLSDESILSGIHLPDMNSYVPDISFKLNSTKLKEAKNNSKCSDNDDFIIKSQVGSLHIITGRTEIFREIIKDNSIQSEISSCFGLPFSDIINVLSGEIELSLKNNSTMKICSDNKTSKHIYVIADKNPE